MPILSWACVIVVEHYSYCEPATDNGLRFYFWIPGGCRKVHLAGRGKGKSGGYRLITFFSGPDIPVFLLTVYSKGDIGNLSVAQVNTLKVLTKKLTDTYKTT